MTTTALILAGHGSHISPHTAGLVWGYVDQLRAWGVADEITAAFWKEQPSLWQVIDTVTADEVVVVPVFTAQGYFTRQVIPAEMRLHERNVHYARTLGEHPSVTDIVLHIVEDMMQARDLTQEQTAVAVIGHGTKRNKDSRAATRAKADYLREKAVAAEVVDIYLDDVPDIPSVYTTTQAPNIVAVPFFLAPGSHVTIDVPDALGITAWDTPQTVNGRAVHYTRPVGTDDVVCELILALANETGIRFEKQQTQSAWTGFPQAGAKALIKAVQAADTLQFGELTLTSTQVTPPEPGDKALTTPAAVRAAVRENPFRSLATAKGLPGGWHVPLETLDDLPAVVETVYPGSVAAWAGKTPYDTLEAVGQRQQGMFQAIHTLADDQIQRAIDLVCAECVLHPAWHHADGVLPCVTPCNHWLSAAKE